MRYFLDTNCLLGVTFLQDRWYPEAKRLFGTDNTLYTGRTAVYEYCCSTETNHRQTADVEWGKEDGRFGEKQAELRLNQSKFDKKMQMLREEDLDVGTVLQEFVDLFDMKESEEEEVKPRMRKYFEEFFEKEGEVTRRTARTAVRDLKDVLLARSFKHKAMVEARIYLEPIRDEDYPDLKDSMRKYPVSINNNADIDMMCDAYYLLEQGMLEKVITGDFVDIYSNRDWFRDKMDLTVMWLLDSFAGEDRS